MTERGTFVVDRAVFDHPRFTAEPFTEREAWLWLISEAAFKPHVRRIGAIEVELKRGQLAASTRFMAKRWQWTEASVRRFLARLKGTPPKIDALIDAVTDAGVTVVSVLNYDVYQLQPHKSDAATDAPCDAGATQERRKVEFKESTEDIRDGERAREACEIAGQIARICGQHNRPTSKWTAAGPVERVKIWLASGWQRDIIIAEVRKTVANKKGSPDSILYFEPPIARAHARLKAPVRTADVHMLGEKHAGRQRELILPIQGGGYQASRDDFRTARAELKEFVRDCGGNGG